MDRCGSPSESKNWFVASRTNDGNGLRILYYQKQGRFVDFGAAFLLNLIQSFRRIVTSEKHALHNEKVALGNLTCALEPQLILHVVLPEIVPLTDKRNLASLVFSG